MSTAGPAPRVTVLVAATDPAERSDLARALAEGGLGVTEATGAGEAVRRAAGERPQLVLLGTSLDGLPATEVRRRLQSEPATAGIPVLLVHAADEGDGGANPHPTAGGPGADVRTRVEGLIRLRRAEEQARAARREADEARARLAAVVDLSEDAVVTTDVRGNVTGWNGAAERLYGHAACEVLGRSLDVLVPADRRAELEAAREHMARGEPVPPLATVRVGRDGRRLDVSVRLRPVRDAGGALTGFTAVARDDTERLRAAEELRAGEERYRVLFERNPHPMFVYDRETLAYLAVNDAAVDQYGYAREEFLRMTVADIRPPEDVPALREMLRRGGAGFERRGVWRHRKKDGSVIDVEILSHDLPFGDRRATIVLAYDVTERRRLEEQFLQSQKMEAVGRLAGGVAHDFNNLLTVINGYADMLLEDLGPGAAAAAHARAIRKAGERAAALTQQLLAFGRKQIVAPRVLDLNALVADTGHLLRRLIGEDVLLTFDLQPALGHVRADANQLEQVILNLAVNARDAMPQGGRLSITTRDAAGEGQGREGCPGPHVRLTVADTGHGMTEEIRRHLFEPFFTTKGRGKGTGLGLATVYGIIKQAGGHIDVETSPGAGTTFRVYLPRAAEAEEPAATPAGAPPVPGGRRTVLLAEDEEGVRALARHVLKAEGYDVLEACDGGEALRLAERHGGRIDLLLSDVMMPGLDGRQLAERVLALDPLVKVLYVSGYTDDEVVRRCVSREDVAFLQKPFSPAALAQKVREVLGAAHTSNSSANPAATTCGPVT